MPAARGSNRAVRGHSRRTRCRVLFSPARIAVQRHWEQSGIRLSLFGRAENIFHRPWFQPAVEWYRAGVPGRAGRTQGGSAEAASRKFNLDSSGDRRKNGVREPAACCRTAARGIARSAPQRIRLRGELCIASATFSNACRPVASIAVLLRSRRMMIGAWVLAPNTRAIPAWISRLKDCLNCAWDSEYLITNTGELRPAH